MTNDNIRVEHDIKGMNELDNLIEQEVLLFAVKTFVECAEEHTDAQIIIEYAGFTEDGEEVVDIAVIDLPIFEHYSLKCKDGILNVDYKPIESE